MDNDPIGLGALCPGEDDTVTFYAFATLDSLQDGIIYGKHAAIRLGVSEGLRRGVRELIVDTWAIPECWIPSHATRRQYQCRLTGLRTISSPHRRDSLFVLQSLMCYLERDIRELCTRNSQAEQKRFRLDVLILSDSKMPGSKYLSSCCSSKSFTAHVTPREDALHAFPEGFIDWPVEDARKSPQQSNNYNCGVFVIKYMEVVTSTEVVTWQDHQGWQADMPHFRAEIAAQIFKSFARHIADKMAAC
ncbi:putative ubiquitin-like-specific protease 1B [Platanthera guangdongensis]|uniref:Ubiquitin-like-specific protease 1B n=1 Tax=Platanthera guangdongensis TaxID=2320717 RepID=A0ABR2MJR4_9ASPA